MFPSGATPDSRWRHKAVVLAKNNKSIEGGDDDDGDEVIIYAGYSDADPAQYPGYRQDLLRLKVHSAFKNKDPQENDAVEEDSNVSPVVQ